MAFTHLYLPRNGKGVSISSIIVPAEGMKSVGPNPTLHKWVGKLLTVAPIKPEVPKALVKKTARPPVPVVVRSPEPPVDKTYDAESEPKLEIPPAPEVSGLDDVALLTETEIRALGPKELKAYAGKFGISSRGQENYLYKLQEAGKIKA